MTAVLLVLRGWMLSNVINALLAHYAPRRFVAVVLAWLPRPYEWVLVNLRDSAVVTMGLDRKWVMSALCGSCDTLHANPVKVETIEPAGPNIGRLAPMQGPRPIGGEGSQFRFGPDHKMDPADEALLRAYHQPHKSAEHAWFGRNAAGEFAYMTLNEMSANSTPLTDHEIACLRWVSGATGVPPGAPQLQSDG